MKLFQLLWSVGSGRRFAELLLGLALFGATFIDAGGAAGAGGPAAEAPPPGGGDEPAENPDDAPSDDQQLEAGAGGATPDDEDDDDADDPELAELAKSDPRFKRVLNRNRKLSRRLTRSRAISDRFRDPVSGHYQDVDSVLGRVRDYDEFDRVMRSNPQLAEAFLAAKEGRTTAALERGGAEPEVQFPSDDELPFDVSTEHGRFVRDELRNARSTQAEVRQLRNIVQRIVQGLQTDRTVSVEKQWQSSALDAAKGIDPKFQRAFVNAVENEFKLARAEGRLSRSDARRVIADTLRLYQAAGKGARRAATQTVTEAARMAQNNNTRPGAVTAPGQPAGGGGKNDPNAGTIRDSRKSFFGRIARR